MNKKEPNKIDEALLGLVNAENRYVTEHIQANVSQQKERIIEMSKEMIRKQLEIQKALPDRAKALSYFDKIADYYGQRGREVIKHKKAGGKVIGTLCVFAPAEIIDAAGAIPLRLGSGFHEAVHPANEVLGDAGLCPLVKSTLGMKMVDASPFYEHSDLIVGPTPCDAKLKVSEVLQDYMPVLLLNLPRIRSSESVRRLWVDELQIMFDKVSVITGNKITTKSLRASVEKYQRAHEAWRKLMDLRMEGHFLWGRDALMLAQVSGIDDIERWTKNIHKLIKELEKMKKKGQQIDDGERPRVMLVGSPVTWPNWKVPNLIEESGGLIVTDDLCSGMRNPLLDPVVLEDNSLRGQLNALAEKYLYPCTCPCFSPNQEREEILINRIREYKVEGVVFHVLRGCHLNSLDAAKAAVELKKVGIPMLKIESEYDEGDVEQIRVRVEAFMEMIDARRE